MNSIFYILVLFNFTFVFSVYENSKDVLLMEKIDEHLNDESVWLIHFYEKDCSSCKKVEPDFSKAAKGLKAANITCAAFDIYNSQEIRTKYAIKDMPSLRLFSKNRKTFEIIKPPFTWNSIIDQTFKILKKISYEAIGEKVKSKKKSSMNAVIELTDSNFDEKVINSKELWLVEFYAPWCGHCKRLQPEWSKAASELEGKIKVGAVDATVHNMLTQRYQIKGFPTIKCFTPNDKKTPIDYNEERTASSIVSWGLRILSQNIAPPDVLQLTSSDVFEKYCINKPMCVIAFFPHILDCGKNCREDYINILTKLGEKYRQKDWGWLWSSTKDQSNLNKAIDIGGYGYPALSIVNIKKGLYSHFRGPFTSTKIDEFLGDVSYGKTYTQSIKDKDIKILEVSKWKHIDTEKSEL